MMQQQPFSFKQNPQALPHTKKKMRKPRYRDPFSEGYETRNYANIMWDKRVYRGNTYAAQMVPINAQQIEEERKRKEMIRRKRKKDLERRKRQLEKEKKLREQLETPPAVEGRRHIEIQTEQYLEEITDRPIEKDVETQTDPFNDRPQSPIFAPAKTGIDRGTQIEDDLFDFEYEVEPILEVLVGKTLEQSMLEVLQEEEMEQLKQQQEQFENKRNSELVETQKMEAAEKRRFEEKERRKKQERERLQKEQDSQKKIASRQFAVDFLSNIETEVFNKLENDGYFYDVVEKEIEEDFLPWIVDNAHQVLEQKNKINKSIVDNLIQKTLKKMLIKQVNYEKLVNQE